jgi:class 3 adenylate cyclase/pSer/pThr/pTyr-binding forkhead associated (FHA) protein
MWSLTITNPRSEPVQIKLVPGRMLIGRMESSDIVINDAAASRRHAEIFYDPLPELVTIKDLRSSNGTYVNRQKITGMLRMQHDDVIRIGQTQMHLTRITPTVLDQAGITGTRQFTRELVLEAVDENPIMLQEISEKLNTVVDVESAISELSAMVKRAMGVDVCDVILAKEFKRIAQEGKDDVITRTIRNGSIESTPHAICVPVVSGEKPLALIYMEKRNQEARPFEKRDLQMAVAISHQTTLTMQRVELLDKIRRESQVRQLLLRFVSPIEADDILKDYLRTGHFPELAEKKVTVAFIELGDTAGLAERVGVKQFSTFLNAFYQIVTQTVFKQGGMVRYLGDGVLAVFMETRDGLQPEDRAVYVARSIIDEVKTMEHLDKEHPCAVGAAINTGTALVGYVGSQDRVEFNVLGSLIKVTYRMQEYAFPNRIFVGASTAESIHNNWMVQKTGSLSMRGNDQPIQVFEVSTAKTAPFVPADKDSDMSAAFKAVVDKLKAKMGDKE